MMVAITAIQRRYTITSSGAALDGAQAHRQAWRLWLYGLAMLVPISFFAWQYPLFSTCDRLTDIGKLSHYSWQGFVGFVVGTIMLFGFYLCALRESRRLTTRQALPAVFGCASLHAVIMALMYPVGAIDIFIYAVRSRLLTTYGFDPIAIPPNKLPADPWLPFASAEWAQHTSPYGPLWNLVAAPITALAGDNLVLALIGFKLLAVVALLGTGVTIAYTLATTENTPPAIGTLLFLWNPLVLWEGVGNGHNDVIMTLPLMLAFLAWAKQRDSLIIPLLLIAALIKYVSILILPLALVALWHCTADKRARMRVGYVSAVLSALVLLIGMYPFYDLTAMSNAIAQQGSLISVSPAAVLLESTRRHVPIELTILYLKLISGSIVFSVLGWYLVVVWQNPKHLPRAAFEVMFTFLLVGMWWYRSWYLIWLVGLAALLPWGWITRRAICWTTTSLMSLALFIWIEAWWHPGWVIIQYVGVAFIFSSVVILILVEWMQAILRRRLKWLPNKERRLFSVLQ